MLPSSWSHFLNMAMAYAPVRQMSLRHLPSLIQDNDHRFRLGKRHCMLSLHRNDPRHTSRSDCSSKEASQEVYECENGDRQMDHQAGHLVGHATASFRLRRQIRLHYAAADGNAAEKTVSGFRSRIHCHGRDKRRPLAVADGVDGHRHSHHSDQCLGRPFSLFPHGTVEDDRRALETQVENREV